MPIITPTPVVLKDMIVQIDADDYAAACSSAALTPTVQTVVFKGLKPTAAFTDVTSPSWTMDLTYAQDWADEDSLANYLLEHAGEQKAAVLKPQTGIGPSFGVNVLIAPGPIGGQGDATAVGTVSLGVIGTPTLIPED